MLNLADQDVILVFFDDALDGLDPIVYFLSDEG